MARRRRTADAIRVLAIGVSLGPWSGSSARAQETTLHAPVPPAAAPSVPIPQETPATLTLGDAVILRFRTTADKLSPQQRVDALEQRLARVLSVPDLRPADVTVYAPPGKAPAIYVIGRKLITVDAATAQASGSGDPLAVATQWAKRLQRVLPFVDWRRPNEHEPVIPQDPPLTVTTDLREVGGGIGNVLLRDVAVFTLYGVQPGGVTAAERADLLTNRLNRAVFKPPLPGVDPVSVAPTAGGGVDLVVNGTRLLTVTAREASIEAKPTAWALAEAWETAIRTAMGGSRMPVAPAAPHAASSAQSQAPTPEVRKR